MQPSALGCDPWEGKHCKTALRGHPSYSPLLLSESGSGEGDLLTVPSLSARLKSLCSHLALLCTGALRFLAESWQPGHFIIRRNIWVMRKWITPKGTIIGPECWGQNSDLLVSYGKPVDCSIMTSWDFILSLLPFQVFILPRLIWGWHLPS